MNLQQDLLKKEFRSLKKIALNYFDKALFDTGIEFRADEEVFDEFLYKIAKHNLLIK